MSTDPLTSLALADPALSAPATTTADLAAILATIATPEIHPLPPRPRRVRLRVAVITTCVLAVVASGAIAGVFQPWHSDRTRQVGPGESGTEANEVFQREYAAAQRKLELPPGSEWPARSIPSDTIIMTGRGGQGESSAVMFAIADWSCFAVDQHEAGRAESAKAGAATLEALVRQHVVVVPSGTPEDGAAPESLAGPIAQFADDGGRERLLDAAVTGARGDFAQLTTFCAANRVVK
jgi:hypothetical protein